MPADPWQHRLEKLRQSRVHPPRQIELGPVLARMAEEFKDAARRVGATGGLWAEHCPAEMVGKTTVQGVARGVLTISVDNASTRFALDRWLREGGEARIIAASATPIRKVKLVVGG